MHTVNKKSFHLTTNRLPALLVLLVGLLYVPFIITVERMPLDDTEILKAASSYSLWQYVFEHAYLNFSGRVTAKMFEWLSAKLPVPVWKLFEFVSLELLIWYLYKFAVMILQPKTLGKKLLPGMLCAVFPLVMDIQCFTQSSLWISGTCNYAFVVIPGVAGAYYAIQYIFIERRPSCWLAALLLLSFCTAGSEQAGAVITVLLIIHYAWSGGERKADPRIFCLLLVQIILIAACYIFCPGTFRRAENSTAIYIEDFYSVPLLRHMDAAYRWFIDSMVNSMGFLFTALWGLEAFVFLTRRKIIAVLFCVLPAVLFVLSRVFPALTEFESAWGVTGHSAVSTVMLIIWSIFLFGTIGTCIQAAAPGVKCVSVLLLLAAYSSTLIMTISPTMYASSSRTKYVSSIIVIILSLLTLKNFETDRKWKRAAGFLIILAIMLFGFLHAIRLFMVLKNGFIYNFK